MFGRSTFGLTLVGLFLLAFAGCSGNRNPAMQTCNAAIEECAVSPEEVTPTPTPTAPISFIPFETPAPTEACLNTTATVSRVSATSNSVVAGDNVIFEINVAGCSRYRVERLDGGPAGEFTQARIWYSKQFTAVSPSVQEGVRIVSIDSTGREARVLNAFAPVFSVSENPSSINLTCSAVADRTQIDVPINPATGMATELPPTVNFSVSSNRPVRIISARNISGSMVALTGLPSGAAGSSQNFSATLTRLWQNTVEFTIRDEQHHQVTRSCSASVYLRPVQLAVAPTCQLSANAALVSPGSLVTFTLLGAGHISSANIDGQIVHPFGGQITLPIWSDRTVVASVSGPGGSQTCRASVNLQWNPVQVGINFEDWTDADYDDQVVCMNGIFEIRGDEIWSRAHQTVSVGTGRRSGCHHIVTMRLSHPNGGAEIHTYDSRHGQPRISLNFQPGTRFEITFQALAGSVCRDFAPKSLGSHFVRHGNSCNIGGL